MASGKATYWANKLLDLILGATAFSAPANIFPALYTVTPGAGGGGTEATSGSYARPSVTNNATNFPASSGGVKTVPGVAINFAAATADWSSGSNMVGLALLDAVTAGNFLYFGDLTVAKPVKNGDTAQIAVSALVITET